MRWRPTWVHWTVIAVALVVASPIAIALAIRSAGFARFDRVAAELAARGEPTSARDLLALAPAVDEERQERWWTLTQATPGLPDLEVNSTEIDDWLRERSRPFPTKAATQLASVAAWLAQGRALLREGPIDASTSGFLHRDLARLESDPHAVASLRTANLLALRAMANGLELAALRGDDDARADLDRLLAALDHPATLIDAMIVIAVASIRDQTYLRLAYRGAIGHDALAAWVDEPSHDLAWVADGFRGERSLFIPLVVADARARPIASSRETTAVLGPTVWWYPISAFLFIGADSAAAMQYQCACDRRLRGVDARLDTATSLADMHQPFKSGQQALAECATTATQTEASHRAARIIGRLLLDAGTADPLGAAIDPAALAGSNDRLALTVTRPAARTVRVAIDATGSTPDFATARPSALALGKLPVTTVMIGGGGAAITLPPR